MNEVKTRKGCKDIWNAFMVEGATFTKNDIPFCPTTAKELPNAIITWEEARAIYKKHRIKKALISSTMPMYVGISTTINLTDREAFGMTAPSHEKFFVILRASSRRISRLIRISPSR